MAFEKEREALEHAISGFGVNEQSLVEIFGNLKLFDVRRFRSSTPEDVIVDGVRRNKTIANYHSEKMCECFLHFHKALEMWTKHPNELDACLIRSAFEGEGVTSIKLLAEVICTRTSTQLVGAKMVYQVMYKTTVEQQLQAYTPKTLEHKFLHALLVGGPEYSKGKCGDELQNLQRDVKTLFKTLRRGGENRAVELLNNETIHYIDILVNNTLFRELGNDYEIMRVIFKCLRDPVSYFVEVLDDAFEANDADALTRVIVTRAYNDMTEIKNAFFAKHGISLQQKIEDVAKGCYKDFILSAMAYSSRDD